MTKKRLDYLTSNSKLLREYTNATIISLANVHNNWRRGLLTWDEAVETIFKTATTAKKEINRLSFTERTNNLKVWYPDFTHAEELTAAAVMEALQGIDFGRLK